MVCEYFLQMNTDAYSNAVNELYMAMNEVFLANNRLYAAAHIVWNWEANEMPSAILQEMDSMVERCLEETVPMRVVEEEVIAQESLRDRWDSSWNNTIDSWLETRKQTRLMASEENSAQKGAFIEPSFFDTELASF